MLYVKFCSVKKSTTWNKTRLFYHIAILNAWILEYEINKYLYEGL